MALTSIGPDVALKRNDSTGRFDFDVSTSGSNKGNPKMDSTRTHAVMTTVFSWKRGKRAGDRVESGGYYWDTSGRRGTLLWTVVQDTAATRSRLLSCADDARQQLINERYVVALSAAPTRVGIGLGRWLMPIQWTTPQGDNPSQALRF